MHTEPPHRRATDNQNYLPNLCSGQSLFRLVVMAELLALLLVVYRGLYPFDWEALALASLMVQWVTLSSAALICRLRPWLSRWPLWLATSASFTLVLTATGLLSLIWQWLVQGRWWLGTALDWSSLGANLALAAIFAGIGLHYFYLQELLARQQRAELEARILALQARMRPHFLFNAMNSIASLIAVDAARAERMVEDLAALFRASLAEPALVSAAQELALARRYLALEAPRLGDRLQVDWQLEDLPEGAKMPSMLLQPLLENAIYHGIGARAQGGRLEIHLQGSNNTLRLMVRNPLGDRRHDGGHGMALDNIRARLKAHFGEGARCFAGAEADHYVVRISYPLAPRPLMES